MESSVKPLKNVSISIIGCGDIGCRIAKLLQKDSHIVTGYARNAASLSNIANLGIGSKTFNLDSLSQDTLNSLTEFEDHFVFYFAPPPTTGACDTRMRAWLAALNKNNLPRRIVYISTTGVYGDHQGRLIDEATPVNPQSERAKRRLDAEYALAEFALEYSIEFVILRVSGIYGENRLPRERIVAKTPILHPVISPITNRIHEDDLVQICIAAAFQSDSGEIYNVSDGDNMTMSDYFIRVAEHLNLPPPPRVSWYEAETILSKGMLSYLRESRLIDNKKVLQQLGIILKYPSLAHFFTLYSGH